jgi:hypothetical protein
MAVPDFAGKSRLRQGHFAATIGGIYLGLWFFCGLGTEAAAICVQYSQCA